MRWNVPVELSNRERAVARHLKRVGKFYVFLREVRHELFDDAFQAELAQAYGKARGTRPIPPAQLAMVVLLQAYDQVSDAEAVITAKMDKRWQLVLDCLDSEDAPFSQGALQSFRERMVAHDLDRKLLERTVAIAKHTGGFGWQQLKAAFDSSALQGAGRVEDTWNLIGRAMRNLVTALSKVIELAATEIVEQAQASVLAAPSIKAALDIDWDDPGQRHDALQRLLAEAHALKAWALERAPDQANEPPLDQALADLDKVIEQDLEPDPDRGGRRIKYGVARDRIPSLGDKEMRHGRKSRSKKFNGFKRHVARIAGTRIAVEGVVLAANTPEHAAVEPLFAAVQRQGEAVELQFDRAYLPSPLVGVLHEAGVRINCKPWRSYNRGRFTKEQFNVDLDKSVATCPAGERVEIREGAKSIRFGQACATCGLRERCTTSQAGRSLAIHPQEALLQELRARRATDEGRAALRERVGVEHQLATVRQLQGVRARYKGERKNTLDLRRTLAVANLQAIATMRDAA